MLHLEHTSVAVHDPGAQLAPHVTSHNVSKKKNNMEHVRLTGDFAIASGVATVAGRALFKCNAAARGAVRATLDYIKDNVGGQQ